MECSSPTHGSRSQLWRATLVALVAALSATACKKNQTADESVPDKTAPPEASALLAVGDDAPAIVSEAHDGRTIDLVAHEKPLVVYFYPKDETGG